MGAGRVGRLQCEERPDGKVITWGWVGGTQVLNGYPLLNDCKQWKHIDTIFSGGQILVKQMIRCVVNFKRRT